MSIPLQCLHSAHKGQMWSLELGSEKVVVRDGAGTPLREFMPEEAVLHFQMPSFTGNVKYFNITLGETQYAFSVTKEGLSEIQNFINRTIATVGPEAVQAIWNRAVRNTLIGLACTIGGIVLTIGSFVLAANNPQGGKYFITWGVVLFGVVMLVKGIYGFFQHGQIRRIAESEGQR